MSTNSSIQSGSTPHNLPSETHTLAPPLPFTMTSINPTQLHPETSPNHPSTQPHQEGNSPSPRSSVELEKAEVEVQVEVESKGKRSELEPVKEGSKYNLRILLMSGQSKTFAFPPHTSVGVVKELVWGEWPGDWNPDPGRPPAPNYFRILYMGRMLADPELLSGLNLKAAPASTIVHLSLRTFPPPEETPKKSILPFSLPTLPRPSGLSSRQNSSNVQMTIAPGSGTGGSAFVPSSARANDPNAQTSTTTTGGGAGGNGASTGIGTAGSARPVTYNGGEEHRGGCKCVIQ